MSSEKFRTLYLTNLRNSQDFEKRRIMTEIKEHFRIPKKYFQSNENLMIGRKKVFLEEIKIEKPEDHHNYRPLKRYTKRLTNRELPHIKQIDKNDKYETIDSNYLRELFNSLAFEKSEKIKNVKVKSIPKEISSKLEQQQKSLFKKIKDDDHNKRMIEYLSKKTSKERKDLLMNAVEKFRLKREIVNTFHYRNMLEDKYEKHKWKISLRRPEHFKGTRNIMINVSTDANPLWAMVKDKSTKNEKIYCYTNDLDEMEMNNKLKREDLNKIDKEINTINTMKLTGKSLFKFEFDQAMQMKGPIFIKKLLACEFNEKNKYSNRDICEHYNISNQKSAISMITSAYQSPSVDKLRKRNRPFNTYD